MAKTLVVYYSQSRGNTKKIAREIAFTMGADLADLKACAKGAKVIAQTDVQSDSTGGDRQETPMSAVTAWAEKLK